jgi:hypothetical protein
MKDDERLLYIAWRNSEAYQVPITEDGEKLAEQRWYGFKQGWEYHEFYLKHKHTDMKDFLEEGD